MKDYSLGVYEKAMPNELTILQKLKLAKSAGYDFMEISIDETDEKLNRLYSKIIWQEIKDSIKEADFPVLTMCLSAHRKYPLGCTAQKDQDKSLEIMQKAVDFSQFMGIRIIQLTGYDVYYDKSTEETKANFIKNLKTAVNMASKKGIILGFETMETPFLNTIEKAMYYVNLVNSPYLNVYPDLGNITNGTESVSKDIVCGNGRIVAVHLKETMPGIYRNLFFGEGQVDFDSAIKQFKNQGVHIFITEFWYDNKTEPQKYLQNAVEFFKNKF